MCTLLNYTCMWKSVWFIILQQSSVRCRMGLSSECGACKTNFQMLFYLPDFGQRDIKAVLKQIRVSSASALSCEESIKPNCSSKEFFLFSLTEIYHFYTAYRCLTSRRSWVQNPPAGWSLYVLSVPEWVLSRYSCTIPQYKDMHVKINWWSAKEPQIRWSVAEDVTSNSHVPPHDRGQAASINTS